MITSVPGVRVGHWTNEEARTGCTAVLLPSGTVASGEVRGGAPGTREWALLSPERTVAHVDAVVLAGGSAFGLAACDGVVRWCEQRGRGYPTPAGPVPIVVGMVLYDLGVGDASVRPGPDEGFAACLDADAGPVASGRVGAGTGATVGKWGGPDAARPGGLGSAQLVLPAPEPSAGPELVVAALVAVNSVGDLWRPDMPLPAPAGWAGLEPVGPEATTIGVVVTNAALTKGDCLLVAQSAHDGLARAVDPVHTSADGDALVAAATAVVAAPVDWVRVLAARVTEAAVRSALGPTP